MRALVRASSIKESADLLPPSVNIIEGDITDPEAVARAVKGCNKVKSFNMIQPSSGKRMQGEEDSA